jgi:hypothetical protein
MAYAVKAGRSALEGTAQSEDSSSLEDRGGTVYRDRANPP